MAFLKNIVLATALLAPLAFTAPLLDERALHTHTKTETVWTTVEEVTTIWVEPGAATQAPEAVTTSITASSSSATTSSAPAAVFAQGFDAPIPSTFDTSIAAPSAAPSAWAPAAAASSVVVPAVAVPSVETPSPIAPSAAAWSSAAPATYSAIANVPKDTTGSNNASPSATCEGQGSACVGEVTHWDGGLGACGWTVNTGSDMQIALPFEFMGTLSNSNPYCGRSLTVFNPVSGTTVSATVGDKCMGCTGRAIDLTDALFNAVTDGKGDGRVAGIQWWFN